MNAPLVKNDTLCINVLRGLAIDAVEAAKSGHPGMPMGTAPMVFTLWSKHLRHDPKVPTWWNRDRFVLSAGHGSMLLYGLLHLSGYDLSIEDLKSFRQFGSKTPGHPENHVTPGVEMATGPLGQGLSTSVGMAIAERYLSGRFNREGFDLFDHRTFVIASDGDLMEGVAQEACSLAGHLGLSKLTVLYDSNGITIDGSTDKSFTENTAKRFDSLGWRVLETDGMDPAAVDGALHEAMSQSSRPTIIIARTIIGFGSPTKAGSEKSHGSPLGAEDSRATKIALGLDPDSAFWVPEEVRETFAQLERKWKGEHDDWQRMWCAYQSAHPAEAQDLQKMMDGQVDVPWEAIDWGFPDSLETRRAQGQVIAKISSFVPQMVGGSADLTHNVFTEIPGGGDHSAQNPQGRNISFGVREHGMMAIANGLTRHGGVRGFGGTFLVFSDYCRPSLRLAALMECPTIACFSHDSIGLGEDGPTHQPIEHVMSLRTIPNFHVLRPADANETVVCWRIALESKTTPCAIITSRQKLPLVTPKPTLDHPAAKGAYVLKEADGGEAECQIVATGSEVSIALGAAAMLESQAIPTRVVSMPCWSVFEAQPDAYKQSIFPKGLFTASVEAGTTLGWTKYADLSIGIDHFGASAPAEVLFEQFGFTAESVAKRIAKSLQH